REAPDDDRLPRLRRDSDDARRTPTHADAAPRPDPLHARRPADRHAVDVPPGGDAAPHGGTLDADRARRAHPDGRHALGAPETPYPGSADEPQRAMVPEAPETVIRPGWGCRFLVAVRVGERGDVRIDGWGSPRTGQHHTPDEPGGCGDPIRGDECTGHGRVRSSDRVPCTPGWWRAGPRGGIGCRIDPPPRTYVKTGRADALRPRTATPRARVRESP